MLMSARDFNPSKFRNRKVSPILSSRGFEISKPLKVKERKTSVINSSRGVSEPEVMKMENMKPINYTRKWIAKKRSK